MPSRWLEEFESAIEEKSKTKTASKKTQTRDTEAALQPIVLNSREVAKVLGVSQDTVCKWSRAGLIPHVRLAGKKTILYPLDELKAWLASQVRAQANVKNRGKRKADRWQG
jgi:excisionase family DNA binding protein